WAGCWWVQTRVPLVGRYFRCLPLVSSFHPGTHASWSPVLDNKKVERRLCSSDGRRALGIITREDDEVRVVIGEVLNGGQAAEESEPGAGDDPGHPVEYGFEIRQSPDNITHPDPEALSLPSTRLEEDHQLTTTIEYSIPETLARTIPSEANSEIRDSQGRGKWPVEKEQPGAEPVTVCQCNGSEYAVERGSAEGAINSEHTPSETLSIRYGHRRATTTEDHSPNRIQRLSTMADIPTTEVTATNKQTNRYGAEDGPGTATDQHAAVPDIE
ncbi:hypothetical protein V496_06880, partial [Pseudogymnoascus sp. VKM F-4515 (FW-2607)]